MKTRLKIVHETAYKFSSEVFIEPHYLRFKPRVTPHNKLESFAIDISSTPTGLSELIDAENNLVHFCWFSGRHEKLSIRSESVVRLEDNNPFDFILFPDRYFDLPFDYLPHLKDVLLTALKTRNIYFPLIEYGYQVLLDSDHKTLSFMTALTNQIHHDFTLETRLEGEPLEPGITFDLKKGSCRDLSWMLIQLLRHMGIATRFVSGYFFVESEHPEPELHAWVEVYLPGAGWVGFDPSNGLLAGSSHVPICSSSRYENTMPVSGSFRGDAASELITSLSMEPM
ncbi:transglutaminase family protein [Tunicatimonas pelagia]|uniref:transglutaminase family protein n=1 Tax=Tunicatimonas pelagia TaxID=931531 RepID=UPI002666F39F|nr:transglutaminase family protein [Tunicatimonas pelagia]WKN43284.1 transglutaminase family protein [Tunicatimonas pelagia]